MNRYFLKKVALDFGRTTLGFASVGILAAFGQAIGLVESATVDANAWKAVGVALGVAVASAALRAGQALFTNLESDLSNREEA